MKPWKTETIEQPKTRTETRCGYVNLSLSPASNGDGTTWQYLSMSFGEFSEADVTACKATWPRVALEMARAELDRFEASLNEGETNEAGI